MCVNKPLTECIVIKYTSWTVQQCDNNVPTVFLNSIFLGCFRILKLISFELHSHGESPVHCEWWNRLLLLIGKSSARYLYMRTRDTNQTCRHLLQLCTLNALLPSFTRKLWSSLIAVTVVHLVSSLICLRSRPTSRPLVLATLLAVCASRAHLSATVVTRWY